MIPLKISESPRRPKRSLIVWPRPPDQLTFIANHSAPVLTMPGVHSTVWIFAISAELISHAVSNRRWSSQRVLALEHVADRVVLLGEQRVQAGQAEPEVLVEAGQVEAGLVGVGEQPAVRPIFSLPS